MQNKEEIINDLVEFAIQQENIRKVIIEAVFEMAIYAEDDSAQQLYDIADFSNLSQKSEEIIFGKMVPDSEGYFIGDDDYDETREGEFLYLYPEATKLLIQKTKEYIMKML